MKLPLPNIEAYFECMIKEPDKDGNLVQVDGCGHKSKVPKILNSHYDQHPDYEDAVVKHNALKLEDSTIIELCCPKCDKVMYRWTT